MIANGIGVATRPEGAIDLAGYPGLTYAPAQHGEGIRFAGSGKPIDDLIPLALDGESVHFMEKATGTPFADICDGLKYLRNHGRI